MLHGSEIVHSEVERSKHLAKLVILPTREPKGCYIDAYNARIDFHPRRAVMLRLWGEALSTVE